MVDFSVLLTGTKTLTHADILCLIDLVIDIGQQYIIYDFSERSSNVGECKGGFQTSQLPKGVETVLINNSVNSFPNEIIGLSTFNRLTLKLNLHKLILSLTRRKVSVLEILFLLSEKILPNKKVTSKHSIKSL